MTEAADRNDLASQISTLVKTKWEESEQPLLLSNLGLWLRQNVENYSQLLGEDNVRSFLASYPDHFNVVKHPTQHAKIGVVPNDVEYEFDATSPVEVGANEDTSNLKRSRGAFYAFVRELSHLEPEEIESVIIPTKVIVKLLEGK